MILLIIIATGILAAVFATQNTQVTSITFINYTIPQVPVYAIALVSLFVGILIFWLVNLLRVFSTNWALRGKDKSLDETKKEVVDLTKEIHQLEIENTKLKSKLGEPEIDEKSI